MSSRCQETAALSAGVGFAVPMSSKAVDGHRVDRDQLVAIRRRTVPAPGQASSCRCQSRRRGRPGRGPGARGPSASSVGAPADGGLAVPWRGRDRCTSRSFRRVRRCTSLLMADSSASFGQMARSRSPGSNRPRATTKTSQVRRSRRHAPRGRGRRRSRPVGSRPGTAARWLRLFGRALARIWSGRSKWRLCTVIFMW